MKLVFILLVDLFLSFSDVSQIKCHVCIFFFSHQANGTSTAGDDDSDKSKSEVNDEAEGASEEVCTSYYFEISLFMFASVIVFDTCFIS